MFERQTMSTYKYKTKPMAHQIEALRMLVNNGGVGGLLMEPGLGKTKVVIDYLGALTVKHGSAKAFITCPLSAVDTWPDEIEKHLPDHIDRRVVVLDGPGAAKVQTVRDLPEVAGLTVVVVNLDVFSQSHTMPGTKTVTVRNAMSEAIRKQGFEVGVVDESHRIKGYTSNVSRAMAALSEDFPRRIIMTGTVAPHSPMDIFAQWRFLNPKRFGTSVVMFRDRYAVLGGFRGKQVVAFKNLDDMRRLRDKDSIVVRKDDALDLPPVTDVTHHVTLTPAEARAYTDMAEKMVISMDGSAPHISVNALTQWMRLRQLTSGHITDGGNVTHFGDSKIKYTSDLVADLYDSGEKVVIFAHFVDDVKRMHAALLKRKMNTHMIYGNTKSDDRRTIRKQFLNADGPMVIVAQMRTVSLAVNEFVAASHAVFLSQSERRDDYEQARDRLNRKGQTKPVTFHHMIVRGSIDEAVMKSHTTKATLESVILDSADEIRRLGR